MLRMCLGMLLLLVLVLGTVGSASAHKITVAPPSQDTPVLLNKPLAANLTPRIFDENGDGIYESAASQGTNQACEAVHNGNDVVDIDGGTCSAP